ncbi:hypothetical protein MKD05_17700 [[Clostridium] innocuum]|nr:hypothetical protein [[Clostridium] innocuum]
MKSEKISIRVSEKKKDYLDSLTKERDCNMSELMNTIIDWYSIHEQPMISNKERLANAIVNVIDLANTSKDDISKQLQTEIEVIQRCLI